MAVAVALVRGFTRTRTGSSATSGPTWCAAPYASCCRYPWSARSSWSPAGSSRTSPASTSVGQFLGGAQQGNGGPVASQEAIKELGTNGGGFFNANSAHPFENPTPLTNLFEIFLMLLIPFSLTAHLRPDGRAPCSRATRSSPRWRVIWAGFTALMLWTESAHRGAGLRRSRAARMEGKETALRHRRLGALRGRHDTDLHRRGQLLPRLVHRLRRRHDDAGHAARRDRPRRRRLRSLRHADHGGHRGLHRRSHGRPDPGVPGQEDRHPGDEVRLLLPPRSPRRSCSASPPRPWPCPPRATRCSNAGPHGFSEVLYAFTSAANNNGSAFAGLAADTPWFNTTLGIAMLLGRFLPIVLVLALAGSLAEQRPRPRHHRHPPHPQAALHRRAPRRDPHRHRPHLLPGPGTGPAR